MNNTLKNTVLNAFQTFEQKLNGKSHSEWHKKRKEAIKIFDSLPFPTTKHEEWKYTNLQQVFKQEFVWNADPEKITIPTSEFKIPNMQANELVFVNGVLQQELSNIISPEEELFIADLHEAYNQQPDWLMEYFAQTIPEEEVFTALNTAFAQNGAFIRVAPKKILKNPIVLYFLSDTRQEATASQPRNLVIIEEEAQAVILEKYDTIGQKAAFSNVVSEIIVKKNALLTHYKIQIDARHAYHIGTTQVLQAEKSNYTNFTLSLSGGVLRNNLNIALDGQYCEANMYGLYMLDGKTHVDNHTAVDHRKPHAFSNELYKGVIDDNATAVFNGKIFVRQDAQKTNAYQQNRNIVLADSATINTKPQLEIWADDVKCSHGATTGSLDKSAFFYLRSRGIPPKEAQALLVTAFAQEILMKIQEEALHDYLQTFVEERLHRGEK